MGVAVGVGVAVAVGVGVGVGVVVGVGVGVGVGEPVGTRNTFACNSVVIGVFREMIVLSVVASSDCTVVASK